MRGRAQNRHNTSRWYRVVQVAWPTLLRMDDRIRDRRLTESTRPTDVPRERRAPLETPRCQTGRACWGHKRPADSRVQCDRGPQIHRFTSSRPTGAVTHSFRFSNPKFGAASRTAANKLQPCGTHKRPEPLGPRQPLGTFGPQRNATESAQSGGSQGPLRSATSGTPPTEGPAGTQRSDPGTPQR